MLDQSDNLKFVFRLCCYFRSILAPRNCSFKFLLYIFVKIWCYHLIHKVETGTERLALFIWNVASVVFLASVTWTSGLAFGLPAILGATAISVIILFQLFFWQWEINFYFTVNQFQIKKSPKITQIF